MLEVSCSECGALLGRYADPDSASDLPSRIDAHHEESPCTTRTVQVWEGKLNSPEMQAAIAWDEAHPPAKGEMSATEARYYSELEAAQCRCVGFDDSRCGWHNARFHSMEGVEEYDRLLDAESQSSRPHAEGGK